MRQVIEDGEANVALWSIHSTLPHSSPPETSHARRATALPPPSCRASRLANRHNGEADAASCTGVAERVDRGLKVWAGDP